jgi:hypothetical protein
LQVFSDGKKKPQGEKQQKRQGALTVFVCAARRFINLSCSVATSKEAVLI